MTNWIYIGWTKARNLKLVQLDDILGSITEGVEKTLFSEFSFTHVGVKKRT